MSSGWGGIFVNFLFFGVPEAVEAVSSYMRLTMLKYNDQGLLYPVYVLLDVSNVNTLLSIPLSLSLSGPPSSPHAILETTSRIRHCTPAH